MGDYTQILQEVEESHRIPQARFSVSIQTENNGLICFRQDGSKFAAILKRKGEIVDLKAAPGERIGSDVRVCTNAGPFYIQHETPLRIYFRGEMIHV